MAYADTLGALNAALAPDPQTASASPADARGGGYADTLSALQGALQPAPPTAIPGSAPTLSSDMAPRDAAVLTIHPSAPTVPAPTERPPIAPGDLPGDVLQSAASGVEKGALGLLALPRTIHDAADAAVTYGLSKITGRSMSDIQAHQAAADAGARQDLGALADVAAPSYDTLKNADEAVAGSLYSPKSVAGDYAQTVGEFVPGSAKNVFTAAVLPGIASEAAGQVTKGTVAEPYARIAGGLIGGGAGAAASLATEAAGKAAGIGKQMLSDYRLPAQADGPAIIAGQRIQNAMADPAKATEALGQDAALVPGSQPTTFQATGDLGLAQMERQLRTTNPQPFIQRDAEQNAARVGSLQSVQPTGSPADVAAQFRSIRDDIDNRAQGVVDAAQPAAASANDAMGGFGTADVAGNALRAPLADARGAAKEEENRLHGLVNPELGVPSSGVAQQAQSVQSAISPSATPMSGEEARIFNVASGYGDTLRFGDMKDLRSSITDATAQARMTGNTQSVRRLTMLRQSVDQALDHGVETQAGQEQVAVSRGVMAPEETLGGRLQQQANEFLQRKNTLAGSGTGDAVGFSGGPATSARRNGTIGQNGGGPVSDAGASGVPAQALPPATPDDVAAYRAANAATKARASTFDEGPVGDVLAPAARGGYDLSDAAVPSKLVPSGKPTDADVVRSFMAAGGSPDALADATAQAVRNKASLGDGTLHPGKVMMYLRQNKDALAEMPPEVAAKFKDAATTQQTVNDAIVRQKALQEQFNSSALARVAGLTDGSDVRDTIGSLMNRNDGVQQIGTLARAAKSDPAAWAGLRRAMVETMFEKSLTSGDAGGMGTQMLKPAVTLRTLADKMPVLRQVFDDKEIGGMMAVARDLDRANSLEALTKGNRGSSNTAQDAAAKGHDGESIITRALLDAAPAVAGKVLGGTPGAVLGWLGAKTLGRGRAAGLESADQLVLAGALDPALAKALVAKVPAKPDSGTADALGSQFARIARGTTLGSVNSGRGRQ